MLPEQRKNIIIDQLQNKKTCTINELISILHVSRPTLHRDLEFLEKNGELSRVHGGAIFLDGPQGIHELESRINKNRQEKEEIARKAISFIEKETCIFLDQSSTCLYLAREIINTIDYQIVIVTNSIKIISEMDGKKTNINIIATGGTLYHGWAALGGPNANKILAELNIDQIFMSCRGISIQKGPMTYHSFIKDLLSSAVRVSEKVNVLADSSKFNKVAAYSIMPIENVYRIISDSELDSETANEYQNIGIEVIARPDNSSCSEYCNKKDCI